MQTPGTGAENTQTLSQETGGTQTHSAWSTAPAAAAASYSTCLAADEGAGLLQGSQPCPSRVLVLRVANADERVALERCASHKEPINVRQVGQGAAVGLVDCSGAEQQQQ